MRTRARRNIAPCFLCLAAAAAFSCEPATSPGSSFDEIQVGTAVSGTVTATDNVRSYSFTAEAGAGYIVFATVDQGTLQVEVQNSAHAPVGGGTVTAGSAALTASPALAFTAPARDMLRLTVRTFPAAAAARYTVLVFRVNDGPEHRSAAFTVGDTVADSIEPVGDVDVYTTHLSAGEDVVAAAEAPGAAGPGELLLAVLPDTGTTPLSTGGSFPGGVAASTGTGRIHASASGTYRFRVAATTAPGIALHGAYRFWTWAVNRSPERLPAALPGDSVVSGESIDRAGDIDEFTFTGTAGALVNVFYQSAVTSHADVLSAGGAILGTVTAEPDLSLYAASTGDLTLPQSGTYTLRVSGDGTALADTGTYGLYVYAVDRHPEMVPAAITPGDTVSGEAIGLPGDVDEFTFSGADGRAYYAFLQTGSDLWLDVVDSADAVLGSVRGDATDTSLVGQMTTVVTPRASGTLVVRVSGAYPTATGPYRLLVYAVDPRPESGPDTLAVGDSLSGQAIDFPGDADTYRVHVTDSTMVSLAASFSGTAVGGAYLTAGLADSASGAAVASVAVYGDTASASGGVTLPPGTYLLRVAGSRDDDRPVLWGPYRLWLFRVGPASETVPDTMAIGGAVSGAPPRRGAGGRGPGLRPGGRRGYLPRRAPP